MSLFRKKNWNQIFTQDSGLSLYKYYGEINKEHKCVKMFVSLSDFFSDQTQYNTYIQPPLLFILYIYDLAC